MYKIVVRFILFTVICCGGVFVGYSCDEHDNPIYHVNDSIQTDFDYLVSEFNEVLISCGDNPIDIGSEVYHYLWDMYDAAMWEFDNGNSRLFMEETYGDIYKYHGSNTEYYDISRMAMSSWIMAMSLSEIVATKGESSNTQTELFKKAYNMCSGRFIPLYGDYEINSDPMIARIAAACVWAKERSNYSFDEIDIYRKELGGHIIDRSVSWTNTEYSYTSDKIGTNEFVIQDLGTLINLSEILPNAPGPFAVDVSTSTGRVYPQEQPLYLFNGITQNYLIDEEIDRLCTSEYNISNRENSDIFRRTVQGIADRETDPIYLFMNRKYYSFDGVDMFTEADQHLSDGYISGTFGSDVIGEDLSYLIGMSTLPDKSWLQELISGVTYISSHSRHTLLMPNYGRRRPGEGTTCSSMRNSDLTQPELNTLCNYSIMSLTGVGTKLSDSGWYDDWNDNGHYDNGEPFYGYDTNEYIYPNTYPSGHSSGVFGAALIMMELYPDRYIDILRSAYSFTVSRTIVRYHWNSDIMYGRLVATMIIPVIHAFRDTNNPDNDFRTIFERAKKKEFK